MVRRTTRFGKPRRPKRKARPKRRTTQPIVSPVQPSRRPKVKLVQVGFKNGRPVFDRRIAVRGQQFKNGRPIFRPAKRVERRGGDFGVLEPFERPTRVSVPSPSRRVKKTITVSSRSRLARQRPSLDPVSRSSQLARAVRKDLARESFIPFQQTPSRVSFQFGQGRIEPKRTRGEIRFGTKKKPRTRLPRRKPTDFDILGFGEFAEGLSETFPERVGTSTRALLGVPESRIAERKQEKTRSDFDVLNLFG